MEREENDFLKRQKRNVEIANSFLLAQRNRF